MDTHALLGFALVFALACGSPGPTIAALLARVLGRGPAGSAAFCDGLMLGDVVWLSAAVFGLAVLAESFQPVFQAIKYAGVGYLLYLAWRLWTAPAAAPVEVDAARGEGVRLFLGGLAVALGNPKTMLFYVALLPTLVRLEAVSTTDYLVLVATVCTVYGAVLTGYVVLAARARRAFTSPRAMRRVNRTTGPSWPAPPCRWRRGADQRSGRDRRVMVAPDPGLSAEGPATRSGSGSPTSRGSPSVTVCCRNGRKPAFW